ncbi:MAG TPA: dihydroorotase family protein [Anaerolineae bacterium]|nr:dihydroorotase family protein [Anaerolineae bacterium]
MTKKPILLIRSGQIGTPQGLKKADVLIRGERIVAVEAGLTAPPGAQLIEASGCIILPGLIDAHVHLREPGDEHKEDFFSGTQAALAGGVTTVLGMPNTQPPITDATLLAHALTLAAQKAVCDHGLFLGATHDNVTTAFKVKEAIGLKLYMGSSTGSLMVSDFAGQYTHFKAYPPERVLALHAEDEPAVQFFARLGQRRPPLCAELAVQRALAMAAELKRRIHICHLSTARELELVKEAKKRGVKVTCEVSPHHLFLSSEVEQHLGPLGQMNPPLRSEKDTEALWKDMAAIDLIATDHAPHTLQEKQGESPPSGVPGLETLLPLLLTAVHQKQMSYGELVRLSSAGPARVFGLVDKGRIDEGAHADLVIIDPAVQWKIDGTKSFTRCGWTPFEGWQVRGKIEKVYLRGQLAFEAGQVLAEPGCGQRVKQA